MIYMMVLSASYSLSFNMDFYFDNLSLFSIFLQNIIFLWMLYFCSFEILKNKFSSVSCSEVRLDSTLLFPGNLGKGLGKEGQRWIDFGRSRFVRILSL
jgi:hypothetical protein